MKYFLNIPFVTAVYLFAAATVHASSDAPSQLFSPDTGNAVQQDIHLGARPLRLVNDMAASTLREKLLACAGGPFKRSVFSLAHRGAALAFPEHTLESYRAAAEQGAGVIECDVTFTKDRELVCRHSQCDLHTTTNILAIPELAQKCSVPFRPAVMDAETGEVVSAATARCCTSDITVTEFKRLQGKMDSEFPAATSVSEYLHGIGGEPAPAAAAGTVMTHAESITLFKALGLQMVPELKASEIAMPEGFTQQDYARKMLAEYDAAGVPATMVSPQSFNLDDIRFWLAERPAFGTRAIYLDGRYDDPDFDYIQPASWKPTMQELAAMGVRTIAPPLWMLLQVKDGKIVPSDYAVQASNAGLDIVTWSLERSGSLAGGGGWYFQSVAPLIHRDGDTMVVLDALTQQVGVRAVFSDWPATVTYYANCMGLP